MFSRDRPSEHPLPDSYEPVLVALVLLLVLMSVWHCIDAVVEDINRLADGRRLGHEGKALECLGNFVMLPLGVLS